MIPAAYNFREAYGHLKMPVVIVAGAKDRLIEPQQSAELHRKIAHSTLRCIASTGHMVHQTATAEIMSAIDIWWPVKTKRLSARLEWLRAKSRDRARHELLHRTCPLSGVKRTSQLLRARKARRRSLNLISRGALEVPSCQTQGLCLAASPLESSAALFCIPRAGLGTHHIFRRKGKRRQPEGLSLLLGPRAQCLPAG